MTALRTISGAARRRASGALVLCGAALVASAAPSASAPAGCRFVGVDDPDFSIVIGSDSSVAVTSDGVTERYQGYGTGTGSEAMMAVPPDGDEARTRGFALHDYEGKVFLTWGTDLLVETCD